MTLLVQNFDVIMTPYAQLGNARVPLSGLICSENCEMVLVHKAWVVKGPYMPSDIQILLKPVI